MFIGLIIKQQNKQVIFERAKSLSKVQRQDVPCCALISPSFFIFYRRHLTVVAHRYRTSLRAAYVTRRRDKYYLLVRISMQSCY